MKKCNAIIDLMFFGQSLRYPRGGCVVGNTDDQLCLERAFVRFRHPTLLKGHYRCMKHRDDDKKTFDNAGWIEEGIPLADTL